MSSPGPALRNRTVALILIAILAVYAFEAHARRRAFSTPGSLGDQTAYLGYARHLYESNYTVVEDRNRMPVFPFLLSLIYKPGLTEDEFLVRAQAFNVNLSVVLLAALFFVFRRFFTAEMALALVAATGFGVFIYRAPNAQVEVLFYTVSFFGFVLLLRMLVAPGWWLALLAGATTGLGHLTKASVLPALGVWVAAFGAKTVWSAAKGNRNTFLRRAAMLAVVVASFLAVVFPYIQTSKRIYGAWFYNVNSTFVMWCDSSTEGYEFIRDHGIRDEWRALPPEQLPSFAKYRREHSVAQIVHRLTHGLRNLSTQNAMAIGYYKFFVLFLFASAILVARRPRRFREAVSEQPFASLFCLLFFAAYVALYGWYDWIVNDTRFVLAIFLPALFAATVFVLKLGAGREVRLFGWRWPFRQFLPRLLFALAAIDVVYNARYLWR